MRQASVVLNIGRMLSCVKELGHVLREALIKNMMGLSSCFVEFCEAVGELGHVFALSTCQGRAKGSSFLFRKKLL